MLNNALCIPCLYEVLWCLTHVNEYTKINAMYGPCNYKAINWETRQATATPPRSTRLSPLLSMQQPKPDDYFIKVWLSC